MIFNKSDYCDRSLRVVLDTNIVMDMLHFANVYTTILEEPIRKAHWLCFTDSDCFAELERVCAYPEFGLDPARQNALLQRYRQFVSVCNACGEENYSLPRCRDRDDQKFLKLAARCRADLLITRDRQLLRLAGHRHNPPDFAIITAETAGTLLQLAPKDPA